MMPLCSSKTSDHSVVCHHASGVKTNCDAYVYSFSRKVLIERIKTLIDAYEKARRSVSEDGVSYEQATINNNLSVIKWTDTLKQSLRRGRRIEFDESRIREVLYRPFTKIWLYEDDRILSSVRTVSRMFGKIGGGLYSSAEQATEQSSRPWQQSRSRTSVRPERISHAGPSRAADNADHRSNEPDDLRGDDNADAGGSPRSGSFNKAASEKLTPPQYSCQPDTAASIHDTGHKLPVRSLRHGEADTRNPEGIMISGTANMEFQALATWTICDLAAIAGSRQTRVMIRRS